MKKGKTNVLLPIWEESQKLVKENKLEEADDMLMKGIYKLSCFTMEGFNDEYKIDGVPKRIWYERFWILVENAGLLPL